MFELSACLPDRHADDPHISGESESLCSIIISMKTTQCMTMLCCVAVSANRAANPLFIPEKGFTHALPAGELISSQRRTRRRATSVTAAQTAMKADSDISHHKRVSVPGTETLTGGACIEYLNSESVPFENVASQLIQSAFIIRPKPIHGRGRTCSRKRIESFFT